GMTYYAQGNFPSAEKYLLAAQTLDPAHFSHPQLVLAEIYTRGGKRAAAVAELEDFLKRHPDAPEAARVRAATAALRK
ncbi:MAG: tetratricopeptide repeat protein, partial [Bryobacteraceae bacterium]